MISASYLVQGTAVEKENKVVDVLLSSANPDEVLAGTPGIGAKKAAKPRSEPSVRFQSEAAR